MSNKIKVTAIVPALNEQETIGNVLRALLESKEIDEVILVDDGSTDRTPEIGKELGVKVISLPKIGGSGKGNAMRVGVENANSEIIVFFDADLKNLSPIHISQLLEPIFKKEAKMVVGIRERRGGGRITKFFIKIDPLLAIGGERAMERAVFEGVPRDFIQGFMVETALNYYCLINKLTVRYVELKGLSISLKEKKWGFWKGFWGRIKMFWELLKIRILIFKRKKEFKIKDVPKDNA